MREDLKHLYPHLIEHCKVTLVEALPQILNAYDENVGKIVIQYSSFAFIKLFGLHWAVQSTWLHCIKLHTKIGNILNIYVLD